MTKRIWESSNHSRGEKGEQKVSSNDFPRPRGALGDSYGGKGTEFRKKGGE